MTKYLCVQFSIVDVKGKVLYQTQTSASARMKWSLSWQDNNQIVLQSSDIGMLRWQRQANGQWTMKTS
jgi:hypothetical protein